MTIKILLKLNEKIIFLIIDIRPKDFISYDQ